MNSNRFYLACLRDTVGTNVSFHCHDGQGYSTDIDRAHVYTRQEAQRVWDSGREFDLPLCANMVDALAEWHVDCQKLPTESKFEEGCNEYVAFLKSVWNGNDVYWVGRGGSSCDFEKAEIFAATSLPSRAVLVPFHIASAAKRPTFCIELIDKRRMVQAAGLVTPEHIKKQRRRKPGGMTRFNCPSCGRLTWQYNPHDFMGCRNEKCDGGK